MPASIHFENLHTSSAAEEEDGLPLSELSADGSHIHGRLEISIDGKALPSLGFFGPDDVCLNTWTQELSAVVAKLSRTERATYVFDEGEQGQPAYHFVREREALHVSVIGSALSGTAGDPDYQSVRCLWVEFATAVERYLKDLHAVLEAEAPRYSQVWWLENTKGAA